MSEERQVFTREEFLENPGRVMQAAHGTTVVVLGKDGEPMAEISVPTDVLPCPCGDVE